MMNYRLHTPEGVTDYLSNEYAFKKKIENNIQAVFDKYGYKAIDTPTFEFLQVYEGMGGIESKRIHKLLDRDGSILGLRPDITPAIARIVATTPYKDSSEKDPAKLCYIGNCFRYNEHYQGKMREFTQAGVEYIGANNAAADTEVLELAINSLLAAGLKDFNIDIGDVAFLQGILEEAGISALDCEKIRESIINKEYVKVNEIANSLDMREDIKNIFADLPLLIGDIALLEKLGVGNHFHGPGNLLGRIDRFDPGPQGLFGLTHAATPLSSWKCCRASSIAALSFASSSLLMSSVSSISLTRSACLSWKNLSMAFSNAAT